MFATTMVNMDIWELIVSATHFHMRVNMITSSSSFSPFVLLHGVRNLIYFTPLLVLIIYMMLLAIFPDNILNTFGAVLGDLLLTLLSLFSQNATTMGYLSLFNQSELCTNGIVTKYF